jgi:hypothetical protein
LKRHLFKSDHWQKCRELYLLRLKKQLKPLLTAPRSRIRALPPSISSVVVLSVASKRQPVLLSHLKSPTTAASPKVTHYYPALNTSAIVDIYHRQQAAADDSFRSSQGNHPSRNQKKLHHHYLALNTAAIVDIYHRQQAAAEDPFRSSQKKHPSKKQKELRHHLPLDKLQFLL